MSVSTENALSSAFFCVAERALCYLRREAQPSCVETVKVAGKPLVFRIDLLQPEEDQLSQVRDFKILNGKAVKLVAVDGQVSLTRVRPFVFLEDTYPDQVRHDLAQSMVVIAFHPDDFDVVPGIGKFADIAEEFPVLFREPAKVQIRKDVAEQDEAAKVSFLQELQRVSGTADFRTEVQVGNDHRIKVLFLHALLL